MQENQGFERMCPCLQTIKSLVRKMKAMTVSARTQQSDVHDFILPVRAAEMMLHQMQVPGWI